MSLLQEKVAPEAARDDVRPDSNHLFRKKSTDFRFLNLANGVSTALAAFAIFILLDTAVRFFYKPDSFDWPVHNYVWAKTQAYRTLAKQPDIMIMGSSLICVILQNAEAVYLKKPVDIVAHNNSVMLEDQLAERLHRNVSTFGFACGGMMASDSFSVAKTIFSANQHPKLLIVGIAPRDFIDNAFKDVTSSDVGRYMQHASQNKVFGRGDLKQPSALERFTLRNSSIYEKRLDFIATLNDGLRPIFDIYFDQIWHSSRFISNTDLIAIKNLLCSPEDARLNQLIMPPDSTDDHKYVNNLDIYRMRYLPFSQNALASQCNYFEGFLKQCNELGIRVIVVNMPITKENIDLLPKSDYQLCVSKFESCARNNKSDYWDLNDPSVFSRKDFRDSVHLNSIGSFKFIQLLAEKIARHYHSGALPI
jgi:hypothetical protein